MSTQPHKKPRLIIIKKEQDKNVVTDENVVTNESVATAVGGRTPPTNESVATAVGGRNPRSTAVGGRNPRSTAVGGRNPRSTAVGGRTPPQTLACTRFNNKTWQEREQWLATNRPIYEEIHKRPLKCIYGTPREISHSKFTPQQNILVIEMNNDENKIQGIGMIKNQTANEVYRTPSAVVSFATAHSTPASGTVLNPDKNHAVNRTPSAVVSFATAHSTPASGTVLNPDKNHAVNRTPSLGGGTPAQPIEQPIAPPSLGGGTPAQPIEQPIAPPSLGGGTPGGTPGGPHPTVKFNIFSDRNYARYIYIGNTHYATRDELIRNHTPDAQYINEHLTTQLPHQESVVGYLERLLFKGPRHMKRGSGITNIKIESNII